MGKLLNYLGESKILKRIADVLNVKDVKVNGTSVVDANGIAQIDTSIHGMFEVVEELPQTGEENVIYLVPKEDTETGDVYDEYIWVDDAWELIGSTQMDLSNYYDKDEVDDLLDDKVDKVSGKGLSTNDYTTTEKNKLSGIETGAQVNTVTGVKGNSETDYRTGNINITKGNIGLGNVPNVSTNNQTPTFTEAGTRANIVSGEKLSVILGKVMKFFSDLTTVAFSGSYNDLSDKPTIPTVNNATLTIQKNGSTVKTFTANASSNVTCNITVPTKTSDITNDSNFVSDANYVHTDVNFTSALKTKLDGIATGATKNTAASAAPGKVASASAVGSSTNYARQDHTHGIDLDTGDANGQVKIAGSNVNVKGLGTAAYTASGDYIASSDNGLKTIKVDRGVSHTTAQSGYWAAMLRSSSAGSPVLPTAGKWWHVLSMDWTGDDVTKWISQLAIPTKDDNGVWYRKNDAEGTGIDASTWHRLAEGDSSGNASNALKVNNLEVKTAVPANAVFTDKSVTAVGNHYAPSEDSSAQLSADASGGAAATWNSTQLVTGVDIKRDAKGHVTGLAVDSIKLPANPNSNTIPSAYCNTAADVAAKTASCSGYAYRNSSYLHVIITTANSVQDAITLNVNGKGAKAIYINGSASGTGNYTLPAGSYIVFASSNRYYFRTDDKLQANITGSAGSVGGKTITDTYDGTSSNGMSGKAVKSVIGWKEWTDTTVTGSNTKLMADTFEEILLVAHLPIPSTTGRYIEIPIHVPLIAITSTVQNGQVFRQGYFQSVYMSQSAMNTNTGNGGEFSVYLWKSGGFVYAKKDIIWLNAASSDAATISVYYR